MLRLGTYWLPSNVSGVDVNDAAPGDRGRGAVVHVVDFQQQAHGGGQWDALVASQGKHPVVVHHCIHGLQVSKLKRSGFLKMMLLADPECSGLRPQQYNVGPPVLSPCYS